MLFDFFVGQTYQHELARQQQNKKRTMSHTWMKDINHKELMEVKGYSDVSRINLKKLLVERDEEIDTHIAETRTLEKQVKIAKMVNKKINKEINSMKDEISKLEDRMKWLKEEIKSYEKATETHKVIEDNLQDKVKQQKQLIDYYELREDYFMKYLEETSEVHEWREWCEARAHKTGNEEHVGILFDD